MFTSTRLIHIDTDAIFNMIYPLASFENCKLTVDEFKKALAGEDCEGCSQEDILLARNLEAACIYMLDTLNEEVSVNYAYKINEILTRGRIEGSQKRNYAIGINDISYIKILRDGNYDLSNYDLSKIVPEIPTDSYLDDYMNVSTETYEKIIHEFMADKQEGFAYNCFMPMIRSQYFKKSNIITGALIVSKIVLQTRYHLMFIESKHRMDLALTLLDCIYYNDDKLFQRFVDIMTKHRIEMKNKSTVKVMIHY